MISCGERLSKDFFHKLKACLFSSSNNNNTIMIDQSRWDQHLADKGMGTFQMIELHWVVERQHDFSSDCFPFFNSVAELATANLSN